MNVTPLGMVSGGNGINTVTVGTGTNTVTTASGSAGNVTGLAGYGIQTSAAAGNTVVNNIAAQVSGTTFGRQFDFDRHRNSDDQRHRKLCRRHGVGHFGDAEWRQCGDDR